MTRHEYERPEMGMPFRVVLYAADSATADAAADAAYARLKELNDVMSDYDPDSELSRLSQSSGQGRPIQVSPDLWFVIVRAQDLARRSGGAFDITVGPYVNLWRRARRQHQLPEPARLAQAQAAVGYQHVKLDAKRRTVELLVPNMRLDLGGIAKGYALGEALEVLRRRGIRQALVEGGGDVVVSEPPPGKPGWRFELTSLDVTNAPPSRFVLLTNHAISTSGDLYQRLEINGKRYSHIIDPRTGIGLTNHSLVNVIAPDGVTADSLTKVLSVLGPNKGMPFIEKIPGVAARMIHERDGRVVIAESRNFVSFYEKAPPQ